MTKTIDIALEEACRVWWNAKRDGKQIATRAWDEIPEEWKADYRLRMLEALQTVKHDQSPVIPT